MFEELSPPYSTIVADPPWSYSEGWPKFGDRAGIPHERTPLPYSSMTVDDVAAMPVRDLVANDAHVYIWTTNRYLASAFRVLQSWGFRYSTTLVWAKSPQGVGPGGAFAITTEFVLHGRRGALPANRRVETSWWNWPRGPHSVKPPAFLDVVESVSPGPYVELFARAPRLGWDSWGNGYESSSAPCTEGDAA